MLPFRNNPFFLRHKTRGTIKFVPQGKFYAPLKRRRNPAVDDYAQYGDSWVARLFVGLSIFGSKKVHTIEEVIEVTRKFLKIHDAPENSSYIAQKGVYTSKRYQPPVVVEENSVQVVIIDENTLELPEEKFKDLIVKLAEHLCEVFSQETVIADVQKNNVSEHVWEVMTTATMKKLGKKDIRKQ